MFAVAAACTLAGATTFREIGDQAADLPQKVLRDLGGKPHPRLAEGRRHEPTWRWRHDDPPAA